MKINASKELELIANKHGGILRPGDVVAFARDPKTALHSRFTWDDSTAAREHRLWQARQLITVYVTTDQNTKKNVQVFVSLASDQERKGGGYRRLTDVLSDSEQRAELLAQALADLNYMKRKYKELTELSHIWQAIEKTAAA